MKKYKGNNIVLLIGNGFDLSHGLKTSYNNFADWFITKVEENIKIYFSEKRNNENFFNEKFVTRLNDKNFGYITSNPDEIFSSIKKYIFDYHSNSKNLKELLNKNREIIHKIINNDFLGKLYSNKYKNWFDIENAYFQELIEIKREYTSSSKKNLSKREKTKKIVELNKLNEELVEIKGYLKEYLKTIEVNSNDDINDFFNTFSIFDDIDYNIFIINFNYTNTIEYYFSEFTDGSTNIKSVNINYIHGNLKEDNIIFGYGNDKHKEYQEIKDLEIDEFLENFKTFAYLKNNNYSKIYDDILDNNSVNDYVVFVLGHSLGTTDKTLLEEIFNNEKCKQIHLFKRSDLKDKEEKIIKSFDNLVFSASRILTNEKDLRKKILNYEDSEFFP